MERVTIFGGSGFLGSYVADELNKREYSVLVADIAPAQYIAKGQDYMVCDILDPKMVKEAVAGSGVVFNFAGLTSLDQCIIRPLETMQQNILGNINIVNTLKSLPIKKYIYASSVYAAGSDGSFYGISKMTSEKIIEEYGKRYDFPYTIVRYGSLYGERADQNNGLYRIIEEAIQNKQITYSGDGDEVREYIHAADAAKLSVDILQDESYTGERITLTGVEKLKRSDVIKMIEEILGEEIVAKQSAKNWEGHYKVTPYSLQSRPAKKLVPNPFIDLGQGIASCIEEYFRHQNDKP
tara:strand:- start:5145 stop:6029 length:885 start_codon:yes stop_codon:yes gene_type:complete